MEPTRNDNVAREAFADRKRKSSKRIANAGVAVSTKGVGTAKPRRGSKEMPEGMRVVGKISAKREEKSTEQLNTCAEIEPRKGDISHFSRMLIVRKLNLVEEELKKIKKNH